MFLLIPAITAEPVCFVQYQTGEVQDLSSLCNQVEKQQKIREEIERRMTPEQRRSLELQKQILEQQRERDRQNFRRLIDQGINLSR